MRIIAGTAGRIAIKVPSAVARPTTDFVRQAVFSILGEKVESARVLDLFAGSGALGLEALSRSATACTFVDEHRQAVNVINGADKKKLYDHLLEVAKKKTAEADSKFNDRGKRVEKDPLEELGENVLIIPQESEGEGAAPAAEPVTKGKKRK